MSSKKGLLLVFCAALLFSIGGLCVKMIPWDPLSINSFRSIISVGILLLFAKLTHHKPKFTKGVLIGAIAMCGTTSLYTAANKLTTAANTILLQFTAPLFVILILCLFFHEKPKRLDLIACFCIFCGILCFFLDSLGSGHLIGDVLAVLAGVCYAGVFLLNKFPGGDPLWATIFGQCLGAVIGFPSLVREPQLGDHTALFFAVLLGVFQLGLAYVCLTTGIQYTQPVAASLVTGIEPILNPVLVALVLGERLTPLAFVGGAIVFLSVMVYNVLTVKAESAAASSGSA